MQISTRLMTALKLGETPAYRVARRAGVNPTTLSKLLYGIDAVKPADQRFIAKAAFSA